MKTFVFAALAVVGALQKPATTTTGTSGAKDHMAPALSAAATLHQEMRKLWSDHVIWTRDYIIAAVGNQPDEQAAAKRLLKNQEDIGNAVAGFYGKAAGDKLTDLLKQHIVYDHMLKFSDALADGIVKQFPAKFSGRTTTTAR